MEGKDEYLKIGGKLLDEIFSGISSIQTMDVKTGLAGIGLGIHYLITKEYVSGNPNVVLEDIDNVIFKHLSYAKFYDSIDSVSLMHILYYLCVRLKDQKAKNDLEYRIQIKAIKADKNPSKKKPLPFLINKLVTLRRASLGDLWKNFGGGAFWKFGGNVRVFLAVPVSHALLEP